MRGFFNLVCLHLNGRLYLGDLKSFRTSCGPVRWLSGERFLALKPGDMSLIPESHIKMEEENHLQSCPLTATLEPRFVVSCNYDVYTQREKRKKSITHVVFYVKKISFIPSIVLVLSK